MSREHYYNKGYSHAKKMQSAPSWVRRPVDWFFKRLNKILN